MDTNNRELTTHYGTSVDRPLYLGTVLPLHKDVIHCITSASVVPEKIQFLSACVLCKISSEGKQV